MTQSLQQLIDFHHTVFQQKRKQALATLFYQREAAEMAEAAEVAVRAKRGKTTPDTVLKPPVASVADAVDVVSTTPVVPVESGVALGSDQCALMRLFSLMDDPDFDEYPMAFLFGADVDLHAPPLARYRQHFAQRHGTDGWTHIASYLPPSMCPAVHPSALVDLVRHVRHGRSLEAPLRQLIEMHAGDVPTLMEPFRMSHTVRLVGKPVEQTGVERATMEPTVDLYALMQRVCRRLQTDDQSFDFAGDRTTTLALRFQFITSTAAADALQCAPVVDFYRSGLTCVSDPAARQAWDAFMHATDSANTLLSCVVLAVEHAAQVDHLAGFRVLRAIHTGDFSHTTRRCREQHALSIGLASVLLQPPTIYAFHEDVCALLCNPSVQGAQLLLQALNDFIYMELYLPAHAAVEMRCRLLLSPLEAAARAVGATAGDRARLSTAKKRVLRPAQLKVQRAKNFLEHFQSDHNHVACPVRQLTAALRQLRRQHLVRATRPVMQAFLHGHDHLFLHVAPADPIYRCWSSIAVEQESGRTGAQASMADDLAAIERLRHQLPTAAFRDK